MRFSECPCLLQASEMQYPVFKNGSDCIDLIVLLFLGNAYMLVTGVRRLSSSCCTESIVLCSPGMGDVLFFEALSHKLSLSRHNSPLSSRPAWQPFQTGKLQVSFPCQVLQPAMLSILLSYLKNVEYQQWLSLVHCQLLYEAILAE